jgi:hypothetical protein
MGDTDLTGHLGEALPTVDLRNLARVLADFETGIGQYRHAG